MGSSPDCTCFWWNWETQGGEARCDLIVDPDCNHCFPCTCKTGSIVNCERHARALFRLGILPITLKGLV